MSDNDEYALIKSLIDCAMTGVGMPDGWRLVARSLQGTGVYNAGFERLYQGDDLASPTSIDVDYERYNADDPSAYNIKSYTASYG